MNPGVLDTRASIWKQTAAASASGDRTPTWAKESDVWTSLRQPLSGSRSEDGGAVARVQESMEATIRWYSNIAPGANFPNFELRITESGERFRIMSVAPLFGRRNYMRLTLELITEELR